jgi:carboxyl-terminal processing protease
MSHLKIKYCAAIAFAMALCLFIPAGCTAPKTAVSATPALAPGPNDARIAYYTAQFLETLQYSLQPLDKAMSEKFFDGYLEMLDPRRENFLQSDIDGFAHYRTNLNTLTHGGRGRADLTPAYEIIKRFLERITQHTDYVNKLLKQDRFQFNSNERIALDRRHAPYPKDMAEAEGLWRQQLRYDYLLAKLDLEFSPTNGGTILPLPKSADGEIANQLARHYNWTLRMLTNWDGDTVLQIYLNALAHAYDPHTDYLNQEHAQNFSIEMSLSLFGIGAQLSEDFGYCTIESLIPGGPADKSGLINKKERVIAVAQSNQPPVNVVDMELPKVVELIRGPKGTQVRLTLEEKNNPASRHVVVMTRDEIKLEDQEAKAQLIEQPDDHGGTNRIGVISVPSFYFPTEISGNTGHSRQSYISADVAKLVKKLEQEKVGGIILDMRNNPGGSLEEAIRFTGLFIKEGPVVLARDTDGRVQLNSASNPDIFYSGPLLVLLNRFSASAAEIAAAALQDYGRAVVVGDISTHGKGTVQSLTQLDKFIWPATPTATNDPGTLKITIRKFYRVTGASTQLKGVEPDIVLPDVLNYSTDIGEGALKNPLSWDSIRGVDFNRFNLVQPYLADLRRRSETRTATNEDFVHVRQDIAQFQKLQDDKTATLNEQEAIRQRLAENARRLARQAEESVRPLPDKTIYAITVENSSTNGLPAPESLCVTNLNAVVTATNANGSVCIMTTNNTFAVGVLLNQFETNTPAGPEHLGTVVTPLHPETTLVRMRVQQDTVLTQPSPDAMLDETEHILEDYISLLSKRGGLIADH